jgi:hypothetical protein
MILRQAHSRVTNFGTLLDNAPSLEIESILRRYGLTSAGGYRTGGATLDKINIQGTPDRGLLDFGGYTAEESFDRPAANFYDTNTILMTPGQIDFVQPVPRIRVSLKNWGHGVTGVDDPKMDNPFIWSHDLARAYRDGSATRAAFKEHFENMVGGYRRDLFMLGGEADASVMESLVRALHDIH